MLQLTILKHDRLQILRPQKLKEKLIIIPGPFLNFEIWTQYFLGETKFVRAWRPRKRALWKCSLRF
jgi:hypothetical protein